MVVYEHKGESRMENRRPKNLTGGSSAAGVGASVRCPEHFGEPLRQHCLCCHRQEPGWMIVARGRHGPEVHCRYCAVALHHWPRRNPAPLSASPQVTLQMESTLIECLRGQPPDSFWVGPVDAEDFVSLAADLLAMLTRRDSQEALTLADHLAAADWWDDRVLGYQVVTALERQEHVISFDDCRRPDKMSVGATCLRVLPFP